MIAKNKIISLTIIGIVIGALLSVLGISGGSDILLLVPIGGIVGFLAGWIWQSRSGEAEK